MKIKTWMLGAAILLILLGGIAAADASGLWKTTNGGSGKAENKTMNSSAPAAIRGSDTFGGIATAYSIPLDDLGSAFALGDPASYAQFQCKDLSTIYPEASNDNEVGVKSVRYFVTIYTGKGTVIPAMLPQSATDILKAHGSLTEEQTATLDQYTIPTKD